jgi:hypothetical protein
MVIDTNIGVLRPRVPASQQADINNIEQNGLNNPGEYHQFFSQGIIRGFIVMDDAQMASAELPGDDRDLTQLMLVHELNHHRNRQNAQNQVGTPITAGQYVNVPLALRLRTPHTTNNVRELFIQELTARHVAYQVDEERLQARGQPTQPLQFGQFFNAALDFAANEPQAYGDNGYMQTLAAAPDPRPFRRQVAIWMRNLTTQEFHSDPIQNGLTQQHFEIEFQFAQINDFAPFGAGSNGMR